MLNMKTVVILIGFIAFVSCNSKVEKTQELSETKQKDFLKGKIIDLTHEFSEETIYWVTAKEFEFDVVANGDTDKGFFYSANNFATAEHGGTHIDAPNHFAKHGQTTTKFL